MLFQVFQRKMTLAHDSERKMRTVVRLLEKRKHSFVLARACHALGVQGKPPGDLIPL